MKLKSKMLAVLLCVACILCQPLAYTFAADAGTNGWEAAKSPNADKDWTNQVTLESLGEGITKIHTTYFKYGGAVNRNALEPIRQGKFSIDIDFDLEKTNVTNWGMIYIPILWDCYSDAGNPDVSKTNNGLTIKLGRGSTYPTGWKIALANNETGQDFHVGEWGTDATNIDLSKKLHIVIETIDGTTKVYINDNPEPYGTTTFTADGSGYLWNGGKPTIAIGGGADWTDDEPGEVYAIIDTHAPDSTEKLQALIDECNEANNPNAPDTAETTFRAAVETAKTAINGAEPVVLAAIDELTDAKQVYESSDKAPEYAELEKEIAACKKLADETKTADTPDFGQTTPAAKNTFTAAIAAAEAKLDGTTEEMTAALAALKAAKKAFSDSILRDTGWRAEWLGHADQAEDKRNEVQIKYLADGVTELVVGDHWTSGAELQNKFLPRKIDDKIVRWEFDFKVLSEGTTSNWFNIAWAWDVYNANEFTTPGNLTNGLYFQLNQLATSPKLSIYSVDAQQECSPDRQWEDMAIDETYHVVWETVRVDSDEPLNNTEAWEPFKFETTIYVNDRVYGTFNTPNQGYYWSDNVPMSFGVGGDGQTRLIMDISPETNEEKLQALISACEELLANTTANNSPALGEVSTAAAAVLQEAINAAKEALNGTEADLIDALTGLTAVKDIFEESIVTRVNTLELRLALESAEAVRNVLSEETAAYAELGTLIDRAKALLADETVEQNALDDQVTALGEAIEKATSDNLVFYVSKLDKFDPTGLTLKSNGKFISFATTNKPGKLYSENWFDVSTTVAPAKKLVFNIKDLDRIDGQYSRVNFTDSDGELAFYVEILKIDGDGVLRVCLPPEDETDPSSFVPLVVSNYVQGEDVQVALEATENGIRISVDGKILYEEENSISSIFNGEDDIWVSLSTGGEKLSDQHMTLDFAAKEITPDPGVDSSTPDSSEPDSNEPTPSKPGNPSTGYATNSFWIVLALTSGIMVVLLMKRRSTQKA